MQNFIEEGCRLKYTNSTGSTILSGAVVVVGSLFGIAITDILDGGSGELAMDGVFEVPKNVGTTITQGDKLYWDTTPGEITKVATDIPIGSAYEDAGSSDTTCKVKLYDSGNSNPVASVVAAVATANATDLTTSEALANQLKTTVNALLTALKNAGIMASS